MGKTISTAKHVSAFRHASGKVGYVLFEQTIDSNVQPNRPMWSVVMMGYAEEAIRCIFQHASACIGGMLQDKSGYITPDTHIENWLIALANPTLMPNVKRSVSIGPGFEDAIPSIGIWGNPSHTPPGDVVLRDLRLDGFVSEAEAIARGGYEASLYADFDLLRSIYTTHPREFRAERFFTDRQPRNYCAEVQDDLGFIPEASKLQPHYPTTFAINVAGNRFISKGDYFLVSHASGLSPKCATSTLADFIEGLPEQMQGQVAKYKSYIGEISRRLAHAPEAPDDAYVELTVRPGPWDEWASEDLAQICSTFGAQKGDTLTLSQIKALPQRAAADDAQSLMYRLLVCSNYLRWTVPSEHYAFHTETESMF